MNVKLALIFNLGCKFPIYINVSFEALSKALTTLSISVFNILFKEKFIIQIISYSNNFLIFVIILTFCIINCATDYIAENYLIFFVQFK